MSFDISFDYAQERSGFFTDEVKTALEFAADVWEAAIRSEFPDVPAGTSFSVYDPSVPDERTEITLSAPIDDLRLFVSAETPPFGIGDPSGGALARAQLYGFDTGQNALTSRLAVGADDLGRGFEPFAGGISFNPSYRWSFDTAGPRPGALDFVSTAVHEIGHVLGIGVSAAFHDWIDAEVFRGPTALALTGGAGVPVTTSGHHVKSDEPTHPTALAPSLAAGERHLVGAADLAMLTDIGYETIRPAGLPDAADLDRSNAAVDGTPGDDRVTGDAADRYYRSLDGADRVDAGAGQDAVDGGDGNDILFGGPGADQLSGGTGDDTLSGGPGDDLLAPGPGADVIYMAPGSGRDTVVGFEPGIDSIVVHPDLGWTGEDLADRATLTADGGIKVPLALRSSVTLIGDGDGLDLENLSADTFRIAALDAGGGVVQRPVARDDRIAASDLDRGVVNVLANDDLPEASAKAELISSPLTGDASLAESGQLALDVADLQRAATFSYALVAEDGTRDVATVVVSPDSPATTDTIDLAGASPASQIAALYVGYFQRVPDGEGFAFWSDEYAEALAAGKPRSQAFDDIAESFRLSGETAAAYPGLAQAASWSDRDVTTFITDVYQNLFGRQPEDTGLGYWRDKVVERLDAGVALGDIVVDIMFGARDTRSPLSAGSAAEATADATTLENRIEVAAAFARRGDADPSEEADLSAVRADRASVEQALLDSQDDAAAPALDTSAYDPIVG